jgi:hypothetical protein
MSTLDDLLKPILLPRMVTIAQRFSGDSLSDPIQVLRKQVQANPAYQKIIPGSRIALAVGSRGITGLPGFVRELVTLLRKKQASVFLVPAMGSHGGATAEGQKAMLAAMGITEAEMGAPVQATMDTVLLGYTEEQKLPVVMDRLAHEADGMVIINRIKPHVGFTGAYESGLMKMIAIGLGKQKGADYCHNLGFGRMAENIEAIARSVIVKEKLLFAVGLVENAVHETHTVSVLDKWAIISEEPALLQLAKSLLPKLPFKQLDVLIMDEIGKDISGTGFDTAVVGRYHTPYKKGGPDITRIGVLDLTERSHGNANGIGIVDFTTQRLFAKFDRDQTYPNSLTTTVPLSVKMPMVLKNDRQVVQAAIKTCNITDRSQVRLIRIKNTNHLDCYEISENLTEEAASCPNVSLLSTPHDWPFDEWGNLL